MFPVVIYSDGTGYNPSISIFTAPTARTYAFYVSIQFANHRDIQLDIVMNGSIKVMAIAWYGSGNSIVIQQTETNLVISHLTSSVSSDRVWVKRYAAVGYFSDGAHLMTFSGCKLYKFKYFDYG